MRSSLRRRPQHGLAEARVPEQRDPLRVHRRVGFEVVDDAADAPRPGADRAPLVRRRAAVCPGASVRPITPCVQRVGAIGLDVLIADRGVAPAAGEDLRGDRRIGRKAAAPGRRRSGRRRRAAAEVHEQDDRHRLGRLRRRVQRHLDLRRVGPARRSSRRRASSPRRRRAPADRSRSPATSPSARSPECGRRSPSRTARRISGRRCLSHVCASRTGLPFGERPADRAACTARPWPRRSSTRGRSSARGAADCRWRPLRGSSARPAVALPAPGRRSPPARRLLRAEREPRNGRPLLPPRTKRSAIAHPRFRCSRY